MVNVHSLVTLTRMIGKKMGTRGSGGINDINFGCRVPTRYL
jgi:hypothetical protein